ncbi:MAG: hypothetical protein U0527_02495 [Candidatus Eisenbacteria bacterium]
MSLIRLPDPLRAVSTLSAHDNRVVLEARGNESDEPLVVKYLTLPASEENRRLQGGVPLPRRPLASLLGQADVFGELPEGGYYFTLEKARGVTADRIGAMGGAPKQSRSRDRSCPRSTCCINPTSRSSTSSRSRS